MQKLFNPQLLKPSGKPGLANIHCCLIGRARPENSLEGQAPTPLTYATPTPPQNSVYSAANGRDQREAIESASSEVENPLSLRNSEFTSSSSGETCKCRQRFRITVAPSHIIPDYLGTSSDWSFTRRILILTHQQVNKTPLPAQSLLFDGAVYDINWDDLPAQTTTPMLPTLDHAVYLINSVKFNCGQIFHLFEEEDFMKSCHRFYADPSPDLSSAGLWYIHFCLVIALGKALLARPHRGSALPCGHDFFVSVFRQLPNQGVLLTQPLVSIEILCCAALYLQCIDHRHYANILVRARLAQLQEMKP